jgi:hypothetical protein
VLCEDCLRSGLVPHDECEEQFRGGSARITLRSAAPPRWPPPVRRRRARSSPRAMPRPTGASAHSANSAVSGGSGGALSTEHEVP